MKENNMKLSVAEQIAGVVAMSAVFEITGGLREPLLAEWQRLRRRVRDVEKYRACEGAIQAILRNDVTGLRRELQVVRAA
jgi:hypothetical protein